MKTIIYPADSRGKGEHGWLHSRFSFSFADYYNSDRMGFGTLRVLNDDIIDPGYGFDTHPHENMEIITVVLEGKLAHKDSMGHVSVIKPDDIQVMSAGTGMTHSEYNHSRKNSVKLLQLWIIPNKQVKPRYDQRSFSFAKNKMIPIVSGQKNSNTLFIHQDAFLSIGNFEKGKKATYNVTGKKNGVYLFLIQGKVTLDNDTLTTRDAIGITDTKEIDLSFNEDSQILIIEVPVR